MKTRNHRMMTLLSLTVAAAPLLALGLPAAAQETLTEVVVTAQKRAEAVQTVPVAIDAVTGAELAKSGVVQAVDLSTLSPNLTTKNAVGNTAPVFALRGISLNDFATNGTQPVGVYLDDVYLVSNSQLGFQLMDMDRVEVLKGPQGTLYGRNTTAGAVSFITNKPKPDFSAGLSVTGGNYDLLAAEGYVNVPLSDKVYARLSLSGERQFDGYFTNETTGKSWGQTRRLNWRGQILWDADDKTSVLVNYHGGVDKSDDWYYKYVADASGLPLGAATAALAAQAGPDIFKGQHAISPQPYIDNFSNGLNITLDHDYGPFAIKSVSAAEVLNYARTEDYGSVPQPNGWNKYAGHLQQYSEELRLTSNGDTAWKWIVGAFASYDRINENDVYNELFNPIYEGYVFNEKYRQETTSLALFTHNDIHLTPNLNLTVGLRYTDEQKHYQGGTLVLQSDPALAFDSCPCVVDTKLHYQEPTGKVGLDYKIKDLMVYGSISRSYKAGGVTGFYVTDPGAKAPYRPEYITAYETGVKSDWFDRRLRVNLSAFYYDYQDLQAFGVIANEFRIFNIQQSRVQGGEIESSFLPVKDVRIDLGVGLLDTRVMKSQVGGVNVGNRLGNAPKVEIDFKPSYTYHLQSGFSLNAALDTTYRSGTYYYVQNDPRQYQKAYVLLGPRLTLDSPDKVWSLTAWMKNAADKRYFREIFNDGGSVIGFPAPPQTFGLTLDYHWR